MLNRSRTLFVALLLLASGLGACGDDESRDSLLLPDGVGDGGLESPDASTSSGCADGEVGCACESGQCSSGECIDALCVDCGRGEQACSCKSNGACDTGLRCDDRVCVTCEAGDEGCPCDGDDCGEGLVCDNTVCVEEPCATGADGCACRSDDGDACDGDLYCDDNRVCRACANDVEGCPCDNDRCSGDVVCEAGRCRAAVTCDSLVRDGDCGENQACTQPSGHDAACEPGSCLAGFAWEDDAGVCDACDMDECSTTPLPSCDPGATRSLHATCAATYRLCVDDPLLGASCGECVAGAHANGAACEPLIDCGGSACGADAYCDGGACAPLPCAPGEAKNRTSGSCDTCTIRCQAGGLTGRVWPFQNNEDECICETATGYFMPTDSNIVPELCDADGDGWVRKEANTPQVLGDAAHLANARCDVLSADAVILWDEYGTPMEVGSCGATEGLVMDPQGAGAVACTKRIPMRLLESERNDVPGALGDVSSPAYDHLDGAGSGGRVLEANEVNALTKACVTSLADYNDNGQNDLTEHQTRPVASPDDQTRLESFSYFTELYRSWYADGKLHIAARSRCDLDEFYLMYDGTADLAGYEHDEGASYWRNCARRRDAAYTESHVGFDFGQWTCLQNAGACDAAPPAHPTLKAGTFDYKDRLLRGHGLCELGGATPADGVWRGMNHHSQFKCVQIDDSAGVQAPKYNSGVFEGSGRQMVVNVCEAAAASLPTHAGGSSYAPVLDCAPQRVSDLDAGISVAWAAVSFRSYGDLDPHDGDGYGPDGATGYTSGCISEDAEWGSTWLCSYPSFALGLTDPHESFGRYSCGDETAFLWAKDDGSTDTDANTLWFDGPNGTGNESVLR